MSGVQSLTEVLILTSFVAEAGYGEISSQTLIGAEAALNAAFKTGRETGIWEIDSTRLNRIGAVLAAHDAQLARAPLGVLVNASERLERLKQGEPERLPQTKRAYAGANDAILHEAVMPVTRVAFRPFSDLRWYAD